jgi:hypothetical protein
VTDKEEEEEDCRSRICDNVPLRNCRLENKTSCPPTDGGTLGRPKSHAPQRNPLYYQEQITRRCLCWSPSALCEAPSSLHGDVQWFLRTDLQPMQLLRARVAEAVAVCVRSSWLLSVRRRGLLGSLTVLTLKFGSGLPNVPV